MTLLYLRHGQTDWNAQGRIQGRTDIPLNETGREQARAQALALVSHEPPVDVIYASPLLRARETAEIVQQSLEVPIYFDERLVERCFGSYEGTLRAELVGGSIASHGAALGEAELERQGVESLEILGKRVCGFLDEITAGHEAQTVLVVAHGGVGRMVHWHFHGQDESDKSKHGNAVLRIYDQKPAWERPLFTA